MILNIIKSTIRSFLRQKLYSSIALIGLSLGMASLLIVTLYVQQEWNRGTYHEKAESIFRVVWKTSDGAFQGFHQPGMLSTYLKDTYPEIAESSRFLLWQTKMATGTEGVLRMGAYVDPSFLQMFTFPMLEGDTATALENPRSIVLSKTLALQLFGRMDVVGETVEMSDAVELQVTGIIDTGRPYPEFHIDYLIPYSLVPDWGRQWGSKCCFTYVQLRDPSDCGLMNTKVAGVMDHFNPGWKNVLYLMPFKHNYLHALSGWSPLTYYGCFGIMAGFVLLIGCINFINLSFARMEKRGREIGIRKVVGSSRTQIALQFLGEAFLTTFASLILAVLLVESLLPAIRSHLHLDLDFSFTPGNVLLLLALLLTTSGIAGAYPAFHISGFSPVAIFLPKHRRMAGKPLQQWLIVVQFSVSIFLLVCLFLVGKQVHYMRDKDLGFSKENLLVVSVQGELTEKRVAAKQAIEKLAAVKSVSISANNLQFWGNSGPLDWQGKSPDSMLELGYNWVDNDFLETLQTQVVRGRFFSPAFSTDTTQSLVINEATYELLRSSGLQEPLGADVKTWFGVEARIIGVLKDFHTESFHRAITPFALLHAEHATLYGSFLLVRLQAGSPQKAIADIRRTIKAIVPDDPCEIKFFDENVQQAYENERVTYLLTASGAVMALMISGLGLFGLTALAVEQRKKEIGVRKVVGANTCSILWLFTGDMMRWIFLSNLIAWPLAWYVMHRWLQEFAFRVDIPVSAFVSASLLTLATALLAIAYQTIRTSETNPIESLRYE